MQLPHSSAVQSSSRLLWKFMCKMTVRAVLSAYYRVRPMLCAASRTQ